MLFNCYFDNIKKYKNFELNMLIHLYISFRLVKILLTVIYEI